MHFHWLPLLGLPDVQTLDLGTEAIVSPVRIARPRRYEGCALKIYFRSDLNEVAYITVFTHIFMNLIQKF